MSFQYFAYHLVSMAFQIKNSDNLSIFTTTTTTSFVLGYQDKERQEREKEKERERQGSKGVKMVRVMLC